MFRPSRNSDWLSVAGSSPVTRRRSGREEASLSAGLFVGALLFILWYPRVACGAAEISVLVPETGGIYRETAASLMKKLDRPDWKVTLTTPERRAARGGNLTIAIGARALELALATRARPVLSVLVPRQTYEFMAAGQPQVSALYLDQPLSRQLQLLALALPEFDRAGIPLGPSSKGLSAALNSAAKDSGIPVNIAFVEKEGELYAALTRLAEDSQAFLLLPDPLVIQRGTLQNFLLHTYRLRKPVLAYSAPLVQSGALLALYSTPAQQGEEAAEWVQASWKRGEFRLGAPRYPKRFMIAANRTVARSLEIELPSEEVLSRQLEARQ